MSTTPSFFKALSSQYRKRLSIQLFAWVIAIVVIAAGWVRPLGSADLDRGLQVLSVLVGFAGVLVGTMLFNRKIEAIKASGNTVREKLDAYSKAAHLQWNLLIGASTVSLFSYFMVGNWAFAALGLTLLAVYGALNPFKQKILLQLRLTETDVAGL
ncbi:MAG: hypothetical protein QM664_14325 [Flavihumibacter sp.]